MGAIATALKESAMWPNTCFVFTTDNGSPLSNGGNNAPLRGSKMTDWEVLVLSVALCCHAASRRAVLCADTALLSHRSIDVHTQHVLRRGALAAPRLSPAGSSLRRDATARGTDWSRKSIGTPR